MTISELYRKVRNAEEPDNCGLVLYALSEYAEAGNRSLVEYRQCLFDQFRLLMDTAADECLPAHWRQLCLDQIHRPLGLLWNLADNQYGREEVMRLYTELRVVGDYIAPSLLSEQNH
ncbi:MAG: hypothetical protein AAF431_17405 [Pseudomonadota bacterium]